MQWATTKGKNLDMRNLILRCSLSLLGALWMVESSCGEPGNIRKILFTYKDKQYTVEDLTGVSEQKVATIIGEEDSKYELKKYQRLNVGFLRPALSTWEPTGRVTLQAYYQHQLQGALEYFIAFEVFNLYKQQHPVEVKDYYRAELVSEAIRRQAEISDRVSRTILSALDEEISESETIKRLKKAAPESRSKDKDWAEGIKAFSLHRPYYALNQRLFPHMVGGKPAPWVDNLFYSSLITCHIRAEIEKDKAKYIRMLEDRFGQRNYFVIRKTQDTDKEQLLKLINLVTNRKGEIARGGLEKINKSLRDLNSPTRIELWLGRKLSIADRYKISENRIKPRQFISLGKTADGMESYLYIFQEEPTPFFKEYPSAPGNALYGTAEDALLRPLVEEVRAAIKPAEGVTFRTADQIIYNIGSPSSFFISELFGVPLPKVLLK